MLPRDDFSITNLSVLVLPSPHLPTLANVPTMIAPPKVGQFLCSYCKVMACFNMALSWRIKLFRWARILRLARCLGSVSPGENEESTELTLGRKESYSMDKWKTSNTKFSVAESNSVAIQDRQRLFRNVTHSLKLVPTVSPQPVQFQTATSARHVVLRCRRSLGWT